MQTPLRRPATGGVCLFVPSLQIGGAEANMVAVATDLARRGDRVRLVAGDARGTLHARVPDTVEVVDLARPRLGRALLPLAAHLRRTRPRVLLATVEHASVVALLAASIARTRTPVVVRVATSLADDAGGGPGPGLTNRLARWLYPHAAGLVVGSRGAAGVTARVLGLEPARITVLPNLTIDEDLAERAGRPAGHRWFDETTRVPVVVFVGRLDPLKNLPLLLDAFARLRRRRPVRLLLLGEGPERPRLEGLVRALGLEDDVELAGHCPDPYPFMRRANVVCLSSDVEGMPNALIEALACGANVVSTDCGDGPRELLGAGRYGRLTPVGDAVAFAEAVQAALDDPRRAPAEAWQPYTVERAGDAYARFLARFVAAR